MTRAALARACRRVVLLAALAALPACFLPAIYNRVEYSSGQATARIIDVPRPGDTKAEVLTDLGPPSESLPLVGQDVFIYNLLSDGTTAFNGTPGWVPVYYSRSRAVQTILFVYFDADGRVERTALTEGR